MRDLAARGAEHGSKSPAPVPYCVCYGGCVNALTQATLPLSLGPDALPEETSAILRAGIEAVSLHVS